ncbi:hypothetical protein RUND412_000001 [Rhizina undulata]
MSSVASSTSSSSEESDDGLTFRIADALPNAVPVFTAGNTLPTSSVEKPVNSEHVETLERTEHENGGNVEDVDVSPKEETSVPNEEALNEVDAPQQDPIQALERTEHDSEGNAEDVDVAPQEETPVLNEVDNIQETTEAQGEDLNEISQPESPKEEQEDAVIDGIQESDTPDGYMVPLKDIQWLIKQSVELRQQTLNILKKQEALDEHIPVLEEQLVQISKFVNLGLQGYVPKNFYYWANTVVLQPEEEEDSGSNDEEHMAIEEYIEGFAEKMITDGLRQELNKHGNDNREHEFYKPYVSQTTAADYASAEFPLCFDHRLLDFGPLSHDPSRWGEACSETDEQYSLRLHVEGPDSDVETTEKTSASVASGNESEVDVLQGVHNHHICRALQNWTFRNIEVVNIPLTTTRADLINAIRGGILYNLELRITKKPSMRRPLSANITFLEESSAREFFKWYVEGGLYLHGSRTRMRPNDTPHCKMITKKHVNVFKSNGMTRILVFHDVGNTLANDRERFMKYFKEFARSVQRPTDVVSLESVVVDGKTNFVVSLVSMTAAVYLKHYFEKQQWYITYAEDPCAGPIEELKKNWK